MTFKSQGGSFVNLSLKGIGNPCICQMLKSLMCVEKLLFLIAILRILGMLRNAHSIIN